VLCVTDIGAYDQRRDAIAAQFAFLDAVLNAGMFPPRCDARGYRRDVPVHALLNKVDRFREALPNAPLGASCDEFAAYPQDAPAAFQPCAAFVKAAVERRLDRSKSDRACLERSHCWCFIEFLSDRVCCRSFFPTRADAQVHTHFTDATDAASMRIALMAVFATIEQSVYRPV
jgi:hypothetical protein